MEALWRIEVYIFTENPVPGGGGMVQTEERDKVFSRISSYREEAIRMQRELTALPALSPSSGGEGEWKKAHKVREYMDAIGFERLIEYNCPDDEVPIEKTRPNQAYIIRGKRHDRTNWIMSHLDIVPPGERRLWDSDPYELRVSGDHIYGRGVEDNQQGMVASILALRALKEEGIQPEFDVGLLFISDEETGNKLGINFILANNRDIFTKEDYVIVPDSGSEEGDAIEVAEKSILWTRFTIKGKQAHASRPASGNNAFRAGSHLVVKLEELGVTFGRKDPIFDPPESTFEPTKKEANVPNVNTIPGEDVFYLDSRILPTYELRDVKEKIEEIAGGIAKQFDVTVDVEYVQEQQAAPATSSDAPVVKALERAIAEVYKTTPKAVGIGGGTVAAYVRKAGFPAVVWARLEETAHQPNEHCNVNNLLGDAKVFAHIFMQP